MTRNSLRASASKRDDPGVLAPPPLIFGGVLALGLLLDWRLAWTWGSAAFAASIAGIVLLAAAAWFLLAALGLFRRAGTRPEPWRPTTAIVTGGIYGISRNPMYVGMALAYAGVALLADGQAALMLLPLALAMIEFGVIRREERYLEGKFGPEYLRYKQKVRRWL